MRMPLIIGLPGVGKSEVNGILSRKLNAPIITTDEEFRRYRAVPINDNRPDDVVIKLFLSQVREDFVQTGKMAEGTYADLVDKCRKNPADAEGRNSFYPSDVARSFGEDVFRTFEWVMNKFLDEAGEFKGRIVDVSSSSALYSQNHEIFTPDKYAVVHLTAPDEVILDNLAEGFRRHQKLSRERGQLVPVRGAYDKAARDAVDKANDDDSDSVIRPALSTLAQSHKWRLEHFNKMAQITIERAPGVSFDAVADKIVLTLA